MAAIPQRNAAGAVQGVAKEAQAKFTGYIEIEGAKGEALTEGFEEWISMLSLSWGGSQNISSRHTGGSGPTGRPTANDIVFTHEVDKASPILFRECMLGNPIEKITIKLTTETGKKTVWLTIDLKKVFISNVSVVSGSDSETGRPVEEVHLNYGELELTYDMPATTEKSGGSTACLINPTLNTAA